MQLNRKENKRLYDIDYRKRNKEKIRERKREYNQSLKGRKCQKRARIKRISSGQHTTYCAKPEQKEKTKIRDTQRRHGEYRECYELMEQIFSIVRNHFDSKYERRKARGYYDK